MISDWRWRLEVDRIRIAIGLDWIGLEWEGERQRKKRIDENEEVAKMTITAAASLGAAPRRQKQTTSLFVSLTISTRFFSFSFLLSSSLLFNSYAVVISRLVFHSNWHFQIQSSFRAVSEQLSQAISGTFRSNSLSVPVQFHKGFEAASEQFQNSFRTVCP